MLRADFGPLGGSREVRGSAAVAGQALSYTRLGLITRPALVNGAVGAVTTLDGEPFSVGAFTVKEGKIVEIDSRRPRAAPAARPDDPRRLIVAA